MEKQCPLLGLIGPQFQKPFKGEPYPSLLQKPLGIINLGQTTWPIHLI